MRMTADLAGSIALAQQDSDIKEILQDKKIKKVNPYRMYPAEEGTATCKINGNRSDGDPVVSWYNSAVENR